MSLRQFPRHPSRNALVFAVAIVFGSAVLWACGPFIDDWLLGSDQDVLAVPTAIFRDEVRRLAPAGGPLKAVVVPDGEQTLAQQTAAADLADVAEALEAAGLAKDRQQALLARYTEVREALRRFADGPPETGEMVEEGSTAAATPPAEDPLKGLQVPEGLPAEIALYLRGALAYHQGSLGDARRHWQAVLDLPAGERRFRSTWAAFMLGKAAWEERDLVTAIRWFERSRQLAAEKEMRDRLGLAAASLGWQARVELERDRFAPALRLYADHARSGDPTALASLRTAAAQALDAPPAALVEVARDDRARPFVTALVLSRTESFYYEDDNGARDEARKWLAAIEKAGVTSAEEADRLAWTAYRAADFDAAGRWIEKAGSAPLGKWVRARLLLRAGRLAEGEKLLAEAGGALPPVELDPGVAFSLAFEANDPVATPLRAVGEAGVVALARQEYVLALDCFLAGGYWRDAAYVAERVLTPDELKAYVDRRWSAEDAAKFDPEESWPPSLPGLAPASDAANAYKLRYLLGRRLARLGRHAEARPYLPADQQGNLDLLAAGVQSGNDARRSAAQRAEGLFQAACVSRWQGLELLSTEADPDWFDFFGQYDLGSTLEERTQREGGDRRDRFAATPDEVQRARRHAAKPEKRFHYRYTAADLGWQAAALLPDGSPEKARLLAASGSWIKDRDPEAANRFYRELVRCCGGTDLGREAVRRKWFPEVQGCGPEGEEQE